MSEDKIKTSSLAEWVDGETPVDAQNLNAIKNKIVSNSNDITSLSNAVLTLQPKNDNTLQTTSKNVVGAINEVASDTSQNTTDIEKNKTNKFDDVVLSGNQLSFKANGATKKTVELPKNSNVTNIVRPVFSSTNPHASNPLDIKTYPGGQDQPLHPKVLYFENGWSGYKYWMAYTPLPDEDNENPCIAASNDMVTWTVPEGLENPLAWMPENGYNSDTHLVYREDINVLECWWRTIKRTEQVETFFRRTSQDGVNWTEVEQTFQSTGSITQDLSPSVIFEENKYKMWTCSNSTTIKYYESDTGTNFTKIRDIQLPSGSTSVWHQDVIHTANGYEMLNYNNNGTLHYCKSEDNITYTKPVLVLEKTNNPDDWCGQNLYRSSFFIKDGYYYVFYTAQKMNTLEWKIGLTRGTSMFNLKGLERIRTLSIDEAIMELYEMIGSGGGTTVIPVETISLNKSELSLNVDGTYELVATVMPNEATNKTITWRSDNTEIATVNNGVVTAIKEGSCIITAKSNNGKMATCNITVSQEAEVPNDGVVQDNLICWLDARDGNGSQTNWEDRTKFNNDMILKGFTFDETSGWTGTALKFDGIKDYCTGVTPSTLNGYGVNNPDFITICLNVTINKINVSQQDLLTISRTNTGRFLLLQDNDISYQAGSLIKSGITAEVGKTYDLVYIYRSNIHAIDNIRRTALYVDGVKKYEDIQNSHKQLNPTFTLGLGSEGGTMAFANMTVNSVKIYDGELTDEQIAQNYNYEKGITR